MGHIALYRKYRSQSFGDLVGQDHVVKTLKGAVASGRFAHAYLFTGPRGTGKTSSARLMAKALNCPNCDSGEPCGECEVCVDIAEGRAMDVIEIDAASQSGVDDVRDHIVQASEYRPTEYKYKVFVIDEVHDLSSKAFDALLKTIEEPPGHIVFILATTEYSKVPPTIRSRCQRFEFHRGALADLVKRLDYVSQAENVESEPQALAAIAKMADGGYRDALTLFEQAMMTAEGKITLDHVYAQLGLIADNEADAMLTAMAEGDVKKIIEVVDEIYRQGRDPRSILEALLHRLSDLTRSIYGLDGTAQADHAVAAQTHDVAAQLGADKILHIRSGVSEAHRQIRDISLPRIWLEAELVRISQSLSAPAPVAAQAPVRSPAPAPAPREAAKQKPDAAKPAPSPAAPAEPSEPAVAAPVEPKAEPSPAAVPEPAAAGGSPEEEIWQQIVAKLSDSSKLARNRLPKSKVIKAEAGAVTIGFARSFDADWVNGNEKVRSAIQKMWSESVGKQTAMQFVGSSEGQASNGGANQAQATKVESAYEGSRLGEVGAEVFGSSVKTSNTGQSES